ncbi:MAG: GIY-YIG nuclease family protein, partial [Caldilinea sp.]
MGDHMLPSVGGSYVLLLKASYSASLTVGRLGTVTVAPGWYLYVGSALGPGGLRGRLHHHMRPLQRPHWHIDYLRQVCDVAAVWYVIDERRWEHQWAHLLAESASFAPCPRFGASDCRCIAHCFHQSTAPSLAHFVTSARQAHPDHPEMNCVSLP